LRKMGGLDETELSEEEHQQAARLLEKREDVS
jgi:hypothetical protein